MRTTIAYILPLVCACACSEGSNTSGGGDVPYQLGQALVIGESESGELVSVDESCDSEACEAIRERCGDEAAYADVVVDAEGHVLDVLCFRGNASVQEIGSQAVPTASAGNNTVLVLDGLDDGADVTGDVVLTGNNAVVYGESPAVSVIGGSLVIEKNNAVARSVSIMGDVTIEKNNAQLSFVEIHGNLTIRANNTTLAKSVVFGEIRVEGNNTVLVQNRLHGAPVLSGQNLTCNDNVSFEVAPAEGAADAGAPAPVDSSDAGASADEVPVLCTSTGGPPDRDRP